MELYYIWLESIKGLGPLSWHMLLKEFGTPYEIYMNRNHLSPQGKITAHCLNLIKEGSEKAMEEAKQIQENCVKQVIHIVKYEDQELRKKVCWFLNIRRERRRVNTIFQEGIELLLDCRMYYM